MNILQSHKKLPKSNTIAGTAAVIFKIAVALFILAVLSSAISCTEHIPTASVTHQSPEPSCTSDILTTPGESAEPDRSETRLPTTAPTSIPTPTATPDATEEEKSDKDNLFDGVYEFGTIGLDGGEIESDKAMRTGYVEVEGSEVYTLAAEFPGFPCSYNNLVEYDADKKPVRINAYANSMAPLVFATSSQTKYIRWYTFESDTVSEEYLSLVNFRLYKGKSEKLLREFDENLIHEEVSDKGIQNMLRRLSFFCDSVLTTEGNGLTIGFNAPIPSEGDPYLQFVTSRGEKIIGMPYSSVRKTNTYVGSDVSPYTFLSALRNPASIVYTSNYRSPSDPGYAPHIVYAWCPYGSVCSSILDYSFGFDFVYTTYEWSSIPGMVRIDLENDGFRIGDTLCNVTGDDFSGGHLAIITDILRNQNGDIVYVEVSEAGIPCMTRTLVTYDYFKIKHLVDYSVYRYTLTDTIPSGDEFDVLEKTVFNDALSLDKGDRSVYKNGENALINILDESAETLEIYFEGALIKTVPTDDIKASSVNGIRCRLYALEHTSYGRYSAQLKYKDGSASKSIIWDFVSVGSISGESKKTGVGESVKFSFSDYSDNLKPVGICLETSTYVTRVHRALSTEEIKSGEFSVSYDYDGYYLVYVIFEDEFGRVTTEKVSLRIV